MSGYFVGNNAVAYIVAVRQAEVFLRGDVAEHGCAVPADHSRTDGAGDVVIARGDVGG